MKGENQIANALEAIVSTGALAGAATLVWREGSPTQITCVGCRDIEARLPIERNTIFRIASMSKPITCAAALVLMEEGRFALDEPISRWAPEFSEMRVLRSPMGPLDETDQARKQITFEDLLTHRSGLTYGSFWSGPLARAFAEALGADIDSAVKPDDWIAALASLPLIDHPGNGFHYGHSTDLLGLLIARIEGAPLGDVLQRRIFGPLGMSDTGFTVPRENRDRCAQTHGFNEVGRLTVRSAGPGGSFLSERPEDMTYESGGQGLWSTLDDYLAFARMLVGAGAVDGARLLKPETVAMMTTNRLTEMQRAAAKLLGRSIFAAGHGYGMGVAVVLDPEKADPLYCGGSAGSVGWPGGFGGWWQADPKNASVMIFLSHNMVELDQLRNGIGFGVYEAILEFQSLASASR